MKKVFFLSIIVILFSGVVIANWVDVKKFFPEKSDNSEIKNNETNPSMNAITNSEPLTSQPIISPTEQTPPSTPATTQNVKQITIQMDETGFTPQIVTIKKGDLVIFKNIGNEYHWPASNIHPTHGIYPEFDSKTGVAPGKSWSYTFLRAGSWNFHDHLYSGLHGTIEVIASDTTTEKNNNTAKTAIKPPIPNPPKNIEQFLAGVNMFQIANNTQELKKWLADIGPGPVMDDLLRDTGGGSMVDCHQQAHFIGRMAYEMYGPPVFQIKNEYCHSGYYHGAMESFLAEKGTVNLAATISEVCSYFDTAFGKFECLHGVGHGILAYEDYDMPKAIITCQKLNDAYSSASCYGGMFMENIVTAQGIGASQGHTTAWVNREDPHFPCDKIDTDGSVQFQCYQMQTSWMLTIYNYDFDRVVQECLRAKQDMIPVCFKSLGRDAAGHTLRNTQKMLEICNKAPKSPNYFDQCIIGGLNVIVDFWGARLEGRASDFCRIVPEESKETCYATLSGRLMDLFRTSAERISVCNTFEEKYQTLCRSL